MKKCIKWIINNRFKTYLICQIISTFLILAITILFRHPRGYYNYSIHLFWSYRLAIQGDLRYLWQVSSNILLFVPEGFFGALALSEKNKPIWNIVLLGFLLSVGIEASQFYWQLGYAELDDIFGNTLGTAIGALFFCMIHMVFLKRKKLIVGNKE